MEQHDSLRGRPMNNPPIPVRTALAVYRAASWAATPLIRNHLEARRARGREDSERIQERFGRASLARPPGPLVWLHAASVGESLSALPLVERLRRDWPELTFLVTTGTVTSARLMAERLPAGVIHQYAPVDLQSAVGSFLEHWAPDLGLFIESELWPNLLTETRARGTELVLVNGRMSAASFTSWHRARPAIRFLLAQFSQIMAQSDEDLEHFEALGAAQVRCLGNLKFAAPPLAVAQEDLAAMKAATKGRPLWLAASTHPGEEPIAAAVHRELAQRHANLLTLIVPRHPDRGPAIAEELSEAGLKVRLRSRSEVPDPTCQIYIADTIGEMGLWYRLAEVVWIGGSLVPKGGQNPLEAAKLDCTIICGPHTTNFLQVCNDMEQKHAIRRVSDQADLATAVAALLDDAAERQRMSRAAADYAATQAGVLDHIVEALGPHLARAADNPHAAPAFNGL